MQHILSHNPLVNYEARRQLAAFYKAPSVEDVWHRIYKTAHDTPESFAGFVLWHGGATQFPAMVEDLMLRVWGPRDVDVLGSTL